MNKAENKSARIFHNLLGYLVAVGAVALATWLKFLAQPKIIPTDVPILYLVAIVPTAIFFGLGPSLLVCFLSFLAYDYYFIPPIHQITYNVDAGPILVIFLVVGVLFSYLASNLRKQNQVAIKEIVARKQSEAELMKHRDHLDELVKQKTSELENANLELKEEISGHKKAQEALTRSEQRWATTLASIGDGVIATDVSGKVAFMNIVAEDLTGWKMAEAIDKPVGEVFKIINEITRQRADNPVNKVLQQGIICSLANHTVLIKQDGTEISIDDSGAPIKNSDGITTGVVLVFRDITERRKAEKVLRQMELRNKLLADILENASQPFGIGLPDGRLGIVNKAFCDLTGYTEEELKTMDWAKLLTPPEYNAMESEKLAELVKTGQPVRYQKEYIRKDNSRVPIELLVHLVRGEDGEAEYYYSFLTDITDRQKAEKALKESEEKYRKLVINIPDEVWFTDTNKNFTLVNPEILDEEEDDVADIAAEAIANRLEVYRTDGSLRPMEESPPLRALRGEYLRNQEEMTKTPVKGELRYRQVSAAPVKDNNGNIIGSVSVLRDVTDQRKAEEENQISLNRFYSVLSEMPMGILLVIEEGLIEFANQSFCDIYNIKESPLYLRNLTSLEVIEKIQNAYMNPEKSVARIMEILAQGEPVKGEDIQMIGGRTVLRDFVPLRMGGNKQGRLWIHRDITERKKAEEELRKRTAELEASNKELEAFSYSVSHDLRAPLRSIAGFSNALLEDYAEKLDEEGKQYLQKIETSSELMGQLMDDLLKLSRVTRSELNFGKVNLSDIAQSVVNELQQAEPKRKIKMSITPDMMVYGDRNLLSLVLQNLLSNAWKFTGKTVEPRIEMGTIEHNGKQTYFVSDNGSGFDMAYTNKLFQPFQRLHKASEFAGTGIGLATVQRIIRRHGGEIWAEGKVGEGATFYFTLS